MNWSFWKVAISASLWRISLDVSAKSPFGLIDPKWKITYTSYLLLLVLNRYYWLYCLMVHWRGEGRRGSEAYFSVQTAAAHACTGTPHREASGQLWKLSGTHRAWAQSSWAGPLAHKCFVARVGHVEHLLVPPGLRAGINLGCQDMTRENVFDQTSENTCFLLLVWMQPAWPEVSAFGRDAMESHCKHGWWQTWAKLA